MKNKLKYLIMIATFMVCGLIASAAQIHLETGGSGTFPGNLTATGTFNGSAFTDGTATLEGGNLTGLNRVASMYIVPSGDVSGIQTTINKCPSDGCTVYVMTDLMTGTISSSITLVDNLELVFIGENWLNTNTSSAIFASGSGFANETTLAANGSIGDLWVTVGSATAFSVGDLVMIQDSQIGQLHGSTNSTKAEVNEIIEISGNDILLAAPLSYDFITTYSANISRSNPIENVIVRGLRLNGTGTENYGFDFTRSLNVEVDACELQNFDDLAIILQNTFNSRIHDSKIHDITEGSAGSGEGVGAVYGTKLMQVYNNHFYAVEGMGDCGGSTAPGWPSYLQWDHNTISSSVYGLDSHYTCHYVTVSNNKFVGLNETGIIGRMSYLNAYDNEFYNVAGINIRVDDALVLGDGYSTHATVVNNKLYNTGTIAIQVSASTVPKDHITISNNYVRNAAGNCIYVINGSNVTVKDNILDGCNYGLRIGSGVDAVIQGNVISNPASSDYYSSGFDYTDQFDNITIMNNGSIRFEGTSSRIILPSLDSTAAPALGFGDGDTGLYEYSANTLAITIGNSRKWFIEAGDIKSSAGTGAYIKDSGAGLNVATFAPYRTDSNTGLGADGADTGSLVAGAVSVLQYNTSSVNPQKNMTMPPNGEIRWATGICQCFNGTDLIWGNCTLC